MVERFTKARLLVALDDTPVVLVQGPRQCGKSTLVQSVQHGPYVTLDDSLARSAAALTPASFLSAHGPKLVLDEVQREPGLFREVKKLVDRDRSPGRFLMTGSANVLLLPKLADSLAGRMEVLPLWPLAQAEFEGCPVAFADRLAKPGRTEAAEVLTDRLQRGGFPEPSSRTSARRRRAWFESYVKALVERDVRDLADIEGLAHLPRLLRALAARPYEVANVSSLSRETGLPHTTLTRYLGLFEGVFLLKAVPAWTTLKARTAKTDRLAFVDSGVWSYLHGPGPVPLGAWEMFVAMELVKQSGWAEQEYEVMHFRSVRHHTVPVVLRFADGGVVGVTVIDRPEPEPADLRALQFFAEVAGPEFRQGVVLHTGARSGPVSEHMWARPISDLWSAAP